MARSACARACIRMRVFVGARCTCVLACPCIHVFVCLCELCASKCVHPFGMYPSVCEAVCACTRACVRLRVSSSVCVRASGARECVGCARGRSRARALADPGVRGAAAIASVLFGDVNPGGKLPVTMYNGDYVDQIAMDNMDMAAPPGRSYKVRVCATRW